MEICTIIPNTTDLTGEYGDNNFVLLRGDSRLSMTIAKDEETLRLNRKSRFLIDDYGSPNVLAYRLTKPLKIGGGFDHTGVLSFVLTECNTQDSDNLDLHIANYYDYFPEDRPQEGGSPDQGDTPEGSGKDVWI